MELIKRDLINGSEMVIFVEDSTPYIEQTYGLKFKKGNKREIKTILGYLKKLDLPLYIRKQSWKNFIIYIDKHHVLMNCEIDNKKYVSDNFKNDLNEEHERLYKVKDVSELIYYLQYFYDKLIEIDDINFSVKDWIIEQNLMPHIILHRRILQVIDFCKYKHITDIFQEEQLCVYITNYLQLILRKTLKNPNDFNYIIGLRINRYLRQDQFIDFNVILKIVIGMIKRKERITYDKIQKFTVEYEKFEQRMLEYINYRINK